MATRVLPGAYVTLNDLSFFPEGDTSLTVGYVLKANKGAVNEATLVTNPTDLVTKFTLTGAPSLNDDPTFWSILKVLAKTNQVYVVRAASNPLYGGALVKAAKVFGTIKEFQEGNIIQVEAEAAPKIGDKFIVNGTKLPNDGYYTVKIVSAQSGVEGVFNVITEENFDPVYKDDLDHSKGYKEYTLASAMAPIEAIKESFKDPQDYELGDNLMLITGADAGAYNGEISFDIVSSVDNPTDLVYPNTMQLNVRLAETGELLETFTFSRDPLAKAIDGTSLYVDNVVTGSAYIQVINNTKVDANLLPSSTIAGSPLQAGAGSDGNWDELDDEGKISVMATALDVFADKTIPISILGNGCLPEVENKIFQQALLGLADTRKDILVVLNNPIITEAGTLGSTKAQAIVDYKKGELGATSYYGCMYAPHVKTTDSFNSRQVKIGADAVAIAGWLDVINTLGYPYAYAGPQNGLVTGVTTDWKIGDESGEAAILNDASINYVAYDGKVGRYYMQCQNTLQIANSALRNIGCFLNVLDLKEHLAAALKEYGQLPITDLLRKDIVNTIEDYLGPMQGTRFYNYAFQDVTTEADIAQDTLRYKLWVDVTRYANRIYLFLNVVNSTFDWSIVQSA